MVLILNLVITFTIPGISIGGHIGGAIAGGCAGFVVLAPPHATMPKWASYAAPITVDLVVVATSWYRCLADLVWRLRRNRNLRNVQLGDPVADHLPAELSSTAHRRTNTSS